MGLRQPSDTQWHATTVHVKPLWQARSGSDALPANGRPAKRRPSPLIALPQYQEAAGTWIKKLQHCTISDDAANSYMLQAFEPGVIGIRLLPLVLNEWRHPHLDDYRPRSGWSLWNCFTDVIGRTRQKASPAEAAISTIRLQKLLTPPLTLDAELSPTRPDTSEEGSGLPVFLAAVE